eukprot:8729616-Alexandrium_andersonii.AAC.1
MVARARQVWTRTVELSRGSLSFTVARDNGSGSLWVKEQPGATPPRRASCGCDSGQSQKNQVVKLSKRHKEGSRTDQGRQGEHPERAEQC